MASSSLSNNTPSQKRSDTFGRRAYTNTEVCKIEATGVFTINGCLFVVRESGLVETLTPSLQIIRSTGFPVTLIEFQWGGIETTKYMIVECLKPPEDVWATLFGPSSFHSLRRNTAKLTVDNCLLRFGGRTVAVCKPWSLLKCDRSEKDIQEKDLTRRINEFTVTKSSMLLWNTTVDFVMFIHDFSVSDGAKIGEPTEAKIRIGMVATESMVQRGVLNGDGNTVAGSGELAAMLPTRRTLMQGRKKVTARRKSRTRKKEEEEEEETEESKPKPKSYKNILDRNIEGLQPVESELGDLSPWKFKMFDVFANNRKVDIGLDQTFEIDGCAFIIRLGNNIQIITDGWTITHTIGTATKEVNFTKIGEGIMRKFVLVTKSEQLGWATVFSECESHTCFNDNTATEFHGMKENLAMFKGAPYPQIYALGQFLNVVQVNSTVYKLDASPKYLMQRMNEVKVEHCHTKIIHNFLIFLHEDIPNVEAPGKKSQYGGQMGVPDMNDGNMLLYSWQKGVVNMNDPKNLINTGDGPKGVATERKKRKSDDDDDSDNEEDEKSKPLTVWKKRRSDDESDDDDDEKSKPLSKKEKIFTENGEVEIGQDRSFTVSGCKLRHIIDGDFEVLTERWEVIQTTGGDPMKVYIRHQTSGKIVEFVMVQRKVAEWATVFTYDAAHSIESATHTLTLTLIQVTLKNGNGRYPTISFPVDSWRIVSINNVSQEFKPDTEYYLPQRTNLVVMKRLDVEYKLSIFLHSIFDAANSPGMIRPRFGLFDSPDRKKKEKSRKDRITVHGTFKKRCTVGESFKEKGKTFLFLDNPHRLLIQSPGVKFKDGTREMQLTNRTSLILFKTDTKTHSMILIIEGINNEPGTWGTVFKRRDHCVPLFLNIQTVESPAFNLSFNRDGIFPRVDIISAAWEIAGVNNLPKLRFLNKEINTITVSDTHTNKKLHLTVLLDGWEEMGWEEKRTNPTKAWANLIHKGESIPIVKPLCNVPVGGCVTRILRDDSYNKPVISVTRGMAQEWKLLRINEQRTSCLRRLFNKVEVVNSDSNKVSISFLTISRL